MKLLKTLNRMAFYEDVEFKDEESKRYLYNQIFSFASHNNIEKFHYITNYVSHATHQYYLKSGKMFNIKYPITISGTNLSNIEIIDANGDIFHICLRFPSTIIYYEQMNECIVNVFIAKHNPKEDEPRFSKKRIRYIIQEM